MRRATRARGSSRTLPQHVGQSESRWEHEWSAFRKWNIDALECVRLKSFSTRSVGLSSIHSRLTSPRRRSLPEMEVHTQFARQCVVAVRAWPTSPPQRSLAELVGAPLLHSFTEMTSPSRWSFPSSETLAQQCTIVISTQRCCSEMRPRPYCPSSHRSTTICVPGTCTRTEHHVCSMAHQDAPKDESRELARLTPLSNAVCRLVLPSLSAAHCWHIVSSTPSPRKPERQEASTVFSNRWHPSSTIL